MKNWNFAFSKRWLGYLALVVIFAIGCVLLANWQLARRDEARQEITRVDQNWDADPLPVDEVLPELDSFDPDEKWTPVLLEGRYLLEDQVLVRNRPLNSRVGFEQLVPFQTDDGRVLIVDRGWVAAGSSQDAPEIVPTPPLGEVTVVARLKASEPEIPGRSAPEGQIATVHLPDLAERLGLSTYTGAYGLVASEEPTPSSVPIPAIKPEPDEGPHLSYAFQWFVFGLMAFIGLGWAVRQEYRLRNEDDPEEQKRAAERERKRAKRAPSDDEIEDALLDARR